LEDAVREHSTELVSQIWEESRNRLRGFIAKRVQNEADAEDILQNVFCKIHQNIHQLEDAGKLYSWVYQLTRNAIIDYYRESRNNLLESEEILSEIAVDPLEKDIEEEVLGWLAPMIKDLPEKYSEALLLTDIEGKTQKELAESLQISFSGAKSRVQRARERLKNVLLDCCHLEFDRAGKIVDYKQRKMECSYCSDH
jgi:RNA polymerase sigma-70 factor (ECF subfamily)